MENSTALSPAQPNELDDAVAELMAATQFPDLTQETGPGRHEPLIELSDGTLCPILTETEFSIETIAHSLALECRFGKQSKYFYSVAQHSILVSKVMERMRDADPFEGLMHDAAEFIMGDLATPIKYSCADYLDLERDLQRRINRCFGLPDQKSKLCHRADKYAMFMEAYHLLPSKGATLQDELGIRMHSLEILRSFDIWLAPMGPDTARSWFLYTYHQLTKEYRQ